MFQTIKDWLLLAYIKLVDFFWCLVDGGKAKKPEADSTPPWGVDVKELDDFEIPPFSYTDLEAAPVKPVKPKKAKSPAKKKPKAKKKAK